MSEIRATTISNAAGTGPVALYKQLASKVTCSLWHNSGTPTVLSSTNTSSLVDNGSGNVIINYTSSMLSSLYVATSGSWAYSSWAGMTNGLSVYTTTSIRFYHLENNVLVDATDSGGPMCALIHGDLA
jgi:hypothetical protein